MDYGDPIHFTFFAVNGAGNGSKANLTYLIKKQSAGYYLIMLSIVSAGFFHSLPFIVFHCDKCV